MDFCKYSARYLNTLFFPLSEYYLGKEITPLFPSAKIVGCKISVNL